MTKMYELECVACTFEETVEGNIEDALDLVEEHESSKRAGTSDHFVNLELASDD